MGATCITAGSRCAIAPYHNNGGGTVTDVTDKAGVSGSAYGLACVWGD